MIEFTLFLLFEKALILLPESFRAAFFMMLARFAHVVDAKHKRVIRQNLDAAFGDALSTEKKEEISRYCYKNLATNLLQLLHNRHYSFEKLDSMFEVENLHYSRDAFNRGKPVIFITAHFGNWELAGYAVKKVAEPVPMNIVHMRMKHHRFEKYLTQTRSRLGINMIEREGAVRHIAKALRNKETIAMLVDQNVGERDGTNVDFFGLKAMHTTAPAALARKFDAVIVAGFMFMRDDDKHILRFLGAYETENTDNAEADIQKATQMQANLIEQAVREDPRLWFWCHCCFKHNYPQMYGMES